MLLPPNDPRFVATPLRNENARQDALPEVHAYPTINPARTDLATLSPPQSNASRDIAPLVNVNAWTRASPAVLEAPTTIPYSMPYAALQVPPRVPRSTMPLGGYSSYENAWFCPDAVWAWPTIDAPATAKAMLCLPPSVPRSLSADRPCANA